MDFLRTYRLTLTISAYIRITISDDIPLTFVLPYPPTISTYIGYCLCGSAALARAYKPPLSAYGYCAWHACRHLMISTAYPAAWCHGAQPTANRNGAYRCVFAFSVSERMYETSHSAIIIRVSIYSRIMVEKCIRLQNCGNGYSTTDFEMLFRNSHTKSQTYVTNSSAGG